MPCHGAHTLLCLIHNNDNRYDILARLLFNKTRKPTTLLEKLGARNVIWTTKSIALAQRAVGYSNMVLYLAIAAAAAVLNSFAVFVALSSFLHYGRYIRTYYLQKARDFDYEVFTRDVMLYKTVAVAQLMLLWLAPLLLAVAPTKVTDALLPPSVAQNAAAAVTAAAATVSPLVAVVAAVGFGITMAATAQLGMLRTYFASELGLVEPKWISGFPYDVIPHPMIVGQLLAFGAIQSEPHVHGGAFWWLIPTHMTLYLVHMAQEHLEVFHHTTL
jgi:hypothetical protein